MTTNPPVAIQSIRVPYYVVRTNPDHPEHHGRLSRNTAPYVLTVRPGGGDYIELAGEAWITLRDDNSIRVRCDLLHASSAGLGGETDRAARVVSHLGRAVRLGEDQADAAFGNDILGERLAEQVAVTFDGRIVRADATWRYAPVDVQWIDLADDAAWEPQTYEGAPLGAIDRS